MKSGPKSVGIVYVTSMPQARENIASAGSQHKKILLTEDCDCEVTQNKGVRDES